MIRNVIESLRGTGEAYDQYLAGDLEDKLKRRGKDLPLRSEAKIDGVLQKEWRAQAGKMAGLFAEELGMSKKEYIEKLPLFKPQPESYKGRFDIPVLVETRIELPKLLRTAGGASYFDVSKVEDWSRGKFKTPTTPYTTWLADGSANLGRSVNTVRQNLASDERGGTVFDGVALFLKDPEILKKHYLDLPGSQVGSGAAPYLLRWGGGPGLHSGPVRDADADYGSVVAGVEIGSWK